MKNCELKRTLYFVLVVLFLGGFVYGAAPKVVKTVPANGAEDVRPGLRKMQIVFDQDMNRGGYSICGSGENFPETVGKPRWINPRTIALTVKLKPGHYYSLSVNSVSFKNFKNTGGEPAEVYPIGFMTAGAGRSTSASQQQGIVGAAPKVVKTIPENGADDVGPGLMKMQIVFDQDMERGGYSVCGGGENFPESVGKPRWTTPRTFVMTVKLKPDHDYSLSINSMSFKNFKSVGGRPAEVYPIRFKTASVKGSSSSVKGKTSGGGRSAGVLLQKGIYAEETEGDLDKAIEIYQQVIERSEKIDRVAAQATYQLGICHLKKGDKSTAAGYFQKVVRDYSGQDALVQKAQKQLSKIEPEKVVSLFEEISPQVIGHLAEQYSKLATRANSKSLPCNAHIYYVDEDFKVYSGGLNYYYNQDGRSQTGKVHLGGTTYPDQTLYDTLGNKLNVEFVPEKRKESYYHIYWIPDEPLKPGEALYYGWSKNSTSRLSSIGAKDKGMLVMQNHYGQKVVETFFLVLPSELYISDYDGTGAWEVDDYSIFPWTQEVERNANHLVNVVIKKRPPLSEEVASWIKELHNPDAPRFVALNKLIRIGEPAVLPLIAKMESSNDWQVPKALGAIKDKRAIGPLIEKWEKADFSPMKEVINEALEILTGWKQTNKDFESWDNWRNSFGQYFTPEDTIKNFMAAAIALDAEKAMKFVAPDSHDYEDIKEIFESPEHPFNEMFQKLDPDVPIEIIEAEQLGKMCTAVWRMTFKEDFTIEGKTFKKGETFDLDGNLRKYDNRWLITGI